MRERLEISILGDICPDRGYNRYFDNGIESVLEKASDILCDSDISVGNLEAPASEKGVPITKCGPCLHCSPKDIWVLKKIGINVLSLANNHILDYGEIALLDTINEATKNGILTFGAGENSKQAQKPLLIEKKGWKIGLISFAEEEFNIATENTAGAHVFDPYVSFDLIEQTKKECDYLIILYHGGIEHYKLPSPLLQKKCHKMAHSGADLILCQHSHCIGTVEEVNNATILYGQGNAVFGRKGDNNSWNLGLLVNIVLTDEVREISYKVIEAKQDSVDLVPAVLGEERIKKMYQDSVKLGDKRYIETEWKTFCRKQEPLYLALFYGWGRLINKTNRLLHNSIASCFIGKGKRRISMNLIRCDAHREVVQTIFENSMK